MMNACERQRYSCIPSHTSALDVGKSSASRSTRFTSWQAAPSTIKQNAVYQRRPPLNCTEVESTRQQVP